MLRSISIRDFVIVDTLELTLEPGFTVLTGETGAGKSILLDALSAALGGRVEGSVVRAGAAKAEVSAVFGLADAPEAQNALQEQDLLDDGGDEAVLRRVIEGGGRSRAYVNGRPVNVTLLRDLGRLLLAIHGQHENQRLAETRQQRDVLDRFAGATALVTSVGEQFRAWQAAQAALSEAERALAASDTKRDELTWHVAQLAAVPFDPAVWQEELAEHSRLAHAQELLAEVAAALALLAEDDASIRSQSDTVINHIAAAMTHDESLRNVATLLKAAQVNIDEAIHDLTRYQERIEPDPERLAQLDTRLRDVTTLARKYRVEPERLNEKRADFEAELAALPSPEGIERLREAAAAALRAYSASAAQLSGVRAKAAAALAKGVLRELPPLAMPNASFVAALLPCEPSAAGVETVEFRFSANAGVPLAPLGKTASGGELSRVGLALQTVLGRAAAMPTLIFDEVDAGVGGAVADGVGRALQVLSDAGQVLCVTHLAPVAAHATQQFRVMKKEEGGATTSLVIPVAGGERVEELARMMGGAEVTAATRKAAKELLQMARESRQG